MLSRRGRSSSERLAGVAEAIVELAGGDVTVVVDLSTEEEC